MKLVTSLTLAVALLASAPAAYAGPCDTDATLCEDARPMLEIEATPATPRAGARISLVAKSPGRGVAFAWDLDGDRVYDDATGSGIFADAAPEVGVRAIDDAGRVATLRQSVPVHAE